jgi:hypothetical protein
MAAVHRRGQGREVRPELRHGPAALLKRVFPQRTRPPSTERRPRGPHRLQGFLARWNRAVFASCHAERGALCSFHGHQALVLFAPSTVIGTVSTTTCFLTAIRIDPLLHFLSTEWSRSDPDLGLTKWG